MALFQDLSEVPDPVLLPDGTHSLTIDKAEVKQSSSGTTYYQFLLLADDEPEAEPIYFTLFPPSEDKDSRLNNRSLRQARDFANAFGLDLGGFDIEDCVGRQATAVIRTKARSKEDQTQENYVAQWA